MYYNIAKKINSVDIDRSCTTKPVKWGSNQTRNRNNQMKGQPMLATLIVYLMKRRLPKIDHEI
jgi:hypothetical protein